MPILEGRGGDRNGKTGPRPIHFGGGGRRAAAHRYPVGLGRVPAPGHAGVRAVPRAGHAGVRAAGGGLRRRVRRGRAFAGPARPPQGGAVGDRPAGRGLLGGGAGAAGQRGAVPAGVQPARGAGQRVSGPGSAGLRAEMVPGPQGLGHRRDRGGHGAFGGVFYAVRPGRGRTLGHPRLFCGAGAAHAAGLRRRGGSFAGPARLQPGGAPGAGAGLPAHAAHPAVQTLRGGGGAQRAAGAAVQPRDPGHRRRPRPAGTGGAFLRGTGGGGQRRRAAAVPGGQRYVRPQTGAVRRLSGFGRRVGVVCLCRRLVGAGFLCAADVFLFGRGGGAACATQGSTMDSWRWA